MVENRWVILGIVVLLFCSGCYRLRLTLVDSSVQKPSNVAVYFSVDDRNKEPVAGLKAAQFEIYEDEKLISVFESKQAILNPKIATIRYTLLLLDMSGSIIESGQVPMIQDAVNEFLVGHGSENPVAIYAFDGREEIVPIAKFGSSDSDKSKRTDALGSFVSKDPSTNLNGAIIKGTELLKIAAEASDVPLRFGTLVIFTDGTDRAHRATSKQARQALIKGKIDSYIIGLDGEVNEKEMSYLSTSNVVQIAEKEKVVSAFRDMGERIKAQGNKYYLLSYCSPSRAGKHKITLKTAIGKDKGKLGFAFNAEGFEPNCDPYDTPGFQPMENSKRDEENKNKNMDKGVVGKDGKRQIVDDESPFAAQPDSNSSLSDSKSSNTDKKTKSKTKVPPPDHTY